MTRQKTSAAQKLPSAPYRRGVADLLSFTGHIAATSVSMLPLYVHVVQKVFQSRNDTVQAFFDFT
jgi:hypothetical protein